jgi:hypothetical protein
MTWVATLLGSASIVTLLVAPVMGAPSAAQAPAPDAVVVAAHGGLLVVDPASGAARSRLETGDGIVGVVAARGMVYVSVVVPDGSGTEIYAVPLSGDQPEMIGRVLGRALVKAVATDRTELVLVMLPVPDADGRIGSPIGLERLPLAEHWRPVSSAPLALRDVDLGVLAPDGRRWYELRPSDGGGVLPPELELAILDFSDDAPATAAILPLPGVSNYHSLLLAPDGQRLYVVDYYAQAIVVINPRQPAVVAVMGFGRSVTKRPSCAAALSPQGDRLYVLGNDGPTNAGDGILAYETASWRLVGHFLPGQSYYCLAVSADGEHLYASKLTCDTAVCPASDPELATIDAVTGRELASLPLTLGDCCAFLLTTANAAKPIPRDGYHLLRQDRVRFEAPYGAARGSSAHGRGRLPASVRGISKRFRTIGVYRARVGQLHSCDSLSR